MHAVAWIRSLTLLVAVALVMAGQPQLTGLASAEAASVPVPGISRGESGPLERPDAVSAMVTARASGKRVEVVAARTETTTTWANPDGTTTLEGHSGVVRFRDQQGSWRDVDLTLAQRPDGTVAPKGHLLDLRLLGKATKAQAVEAISVTEPGDRSVSLGWPGTLPEPVLDGTRATYEEVTPGVDMVVEALRTGFEQFMVLRERPTGPASWDLPLRTKGLTARAEGDGSVSFVDAKGKVRSKIPAAVAWDSQVDELTGESTNVAPVALSVTQKNPGQAVLTVTPDAEWLADPATIFPVTVDPAYASATRSASFDTFVQQGYGTSQAGATELKLATTGPVRSPDRSSTSSWGR